MAQRPLIGIGDEGAERSLSHPHTGEHLPVFRLAGLHHQHALFFGLPEVDFFQLLCPQEAEPLGVGDAEVEFHEGLYFIPLLKLVVDVFEIELPFLRLLKEMIQEI
ncbi:MAG: hypothetical protein KDD28_10285 [Phaeodactylibacter sp.]|nr:hypothetical protein [Phaeodactylibacter sp.]